jgi:uncharacterized protein (DUF2147 family)
MLHCPRNIMRTISYSGLFLATCLAPAFLTPVFLTPALAADDPTGDWRVADGVANIRVAECNGRMWGAVSWEKVPGGRDKNNPDVSKQSRPTLGMPILIDMKKKPGVEQWEGQVYNAKDGQLYNSTIRPIGSDQLEIKGCVLGFLCGGETWTRVAGPIPASPANSMARGAPRTTGAASRATAQPSGAPAPKTTGSVSPGSRAHVQKQAAAAQPADPVGDICLIPEIARFAH